MALVAQDMADAIKAEMAGEDAIMFAGATSQHLVAWAQGVINELTINGSATFGTTPSGHSISGLTDTSMAAYIVAELAFYDPATSKLIDFCDAICTHVESDAVVTYVSPVGLPNPALNYLNGGTISGMNGTVLANLVATTVGYPSTSSLLIAFCTAVVNYIHANAEVEVGVIS